ncbi:UNVERIFIED_CONTAM: hypothetical protein K2H54_042632 [Gekko kuhli]
MGRATGKPKTRPALPALQPSGRLGGTPHLSFPSPGPAAAAALSAMSPEEPPTLPENYLNQLPDEAPVVRAAVAELRRRADEERLQPWPLALSDAFLARFLRARDFHLEQAWKVKGALMREAAGVRRVRATHPSRLLL